jgi:hypothetical protein
MYEEKKVYGLFFTVIVLLLQRSYRKKKFPSFSARILIVIVISSIYQRQSSICIYMRYFIIIKANTFLNQSEDELNFCTQMNVLSRSHRTFFFQLFIFSSFSCSFFQSLDLSRLLTGSAREHSIDMYIPFSKNGKN